MQITKFFSLHSLKDDIEENSFDINQHVYSVFSRTLVNTAQSLDRLMQNRRHSPDVIYHDIETVLNQVPTDGVKSLNKLIKRMRRLENQYDAQKKCNTLYFNHRAFAVISHIIQLTGIAVSGTMANIGARMSFGVWIIFAISVVSYLITTLTQYSKQREDYLNSIDEVLKQLDYVLQQTKGYEAIFKSAYNFLKEKSAAKDKALRLCKNIDKAKNILLGTLRRVKRNRSLSLKKTQGASETP